MIDISSLSERDIGSWVIYRKGPRTNRGRILRWNDRFIYVVFWCGTNDWKNFRNYAATATPPEDLEFDVS
ncbi:MAG: hypothetical protein JO170_21045 [Verrucomicrobia bacterium]|nr:hypothetical protein [Verrucomicrobiota bacterium]